MPGSERRGELPSPSFMEWWARLEPRLLAWAERRTGSRAVAEDLVQDTAIVALAQSHFNGEDHLTGWAFLRLRWYFLDWLESQQRLQSNAKARGPLEPDQPHKVFLLELLGLIEKLPERQKTVILGLIDGKSTDELAEELGVAVSTVRSLRRHARSRLADLMRSGAPTEEGSKELDS